MADPLTHSAALLSQARRALHSGDALPGALRDTIRYSWIRSRTAAAPLERIEAPYVPPDGSSDRLVQAAGPILDRFAQQLAGTHVSLVLADRSARVVGRWAADRTALTRLSRLSIDEGFVLAEDAAGTNGIGTALEELAPVTIFGGEHYAESLQRLVCVGVPIRHPLTRRIEGVLDLACPTQDSTGLLMPTALDLGAQIERELSDRSPQRERAVFDAFVARSRSTSAALVALSEQYMVTNAAAADLLEPHDQAILWEQAEESVRSGRVVERVLSLTSAESITARCSPIILGSSAVGVLIEAVSESRRSAAHPRDRRDVRPVTSLGAKRVSARSAAGLRFEHELAALVSTRVSRVLIQGEPGSGRTAAIRRLHEGLSPDTDLVIKAAAMASVRSQRGWLTDLEALLSDPAVTCAVTDLEDLDARGLRALAKIADQSQESSVLLLTSSAAVSPGRLRVAGTVLRVPPLRERREDVPDLAYAIIRELGSRARIGNRALSALMNHSWPGNLHELREVLTSAVAAAGDRDLGLVDLGPEFRGGVDGRRSLTRIEALERDAIVGALRESNGNRVKAAEALGMSRSTLYRRLRLFGLEPHRTVL